MDQSKDRLVWLDMEMTGLDPKTCVPLQVAMIITDSELKELDSVELTIWQPASALERIEPFVRKMHTQNGLLEAVQRSEVSVADAEKKLMGMLSRWTPYREGILCGNSIHTDRRFIEAYFPVVDGYLHYRMVDVSSMKELVRRWYGPEVSFTKGIGAHTALSDIRESIGELKHYRATVMKPRS
ncbi:MAG: oligoribonuclease [Myxococcota bacterium]